jgi:hypothetical protein
MPPYVSPYVRGIRPAPPVRIVKKNYTKVDNDFPSLNSKPIVKGVTETAWGSSSKSFKEIVENNEVLFDYDILERLDGETSVSHFNRISEIFKRTTTHHTYNIYVVSSNTKSYRVAARNEIIARMLCQLSHNKYSNSSLDSAFVHFKQDTLDQMYSDDEIWEEVMSYVGGDKNRKDQAILMYYRKTQNIKGASEIFWFNSKKTTCKKTEEKSISKEKILY